MSIAKGAKNTATSPLSRQYVARTYGTLRTASVLRKQESGVLGLLDVAQLSPHHRPHNPDLKIRDNECVCGPLIAPAARDPLHYDANDLEYLVESVNERWSNSISFVSNFPQTEYSVGFRREAFTDKKLTKPSPCVGNILSGD